MPRFPLAFVLVITFGLFPGANVLADFGDIEFSADIVQSSPQGGESIGKMYVGKDRVRTDMEQNEQQIIRIVDNGKRTEWLLYPSQHSYIKMGAEEGPAAATEQQPRNNPCQGMQDVTCKNLGKETISGRDAVKWEMSFLHQGKTLTSTQWIDVERNILLRQVMPDEQMTELKLVGSDKIDGRTVEKWEMLVSSKERAPQRSYQWYDPKLGLAIREEFTGGYVRELRNIREAKQPDILFSIPAGYKQISVPTKIPPLDR